MTETYWVQAPLKKLAEETLSRVDAYYRWVSETGRMALWRRSTRLYYGLDPNGGWARSSAVTFGGDQGELVLLRINHYFSLIQHMHTLITGSRPAVRARGTGDDRESLEQVVIADQILEHDLAHTELGNLLSRAALLSLIWTEGWIYQAWDHQKGEAFTADPETGRIIHEGGIVTEVVRPIDVIRDPLATDDDWLIYRRPRNRWDLMAEYPEREETIRKMASTTEAKQSEVLFSSRKGSSVSEDNVFTFELYKRRSPAVPEGRWALIGGDEVFNHGPLPYDKLPLHKLWPDEEDQSNFGHSPTMHLMAPQEAYDSCASVAMTNHEAFGVQALWSRKGDDLDQEELVKGLRVVYSEEKPEPIQFTRIAEDTYRLAEMFKREMETLIGINSVARGDPEASLKSGAALALVHSMAVQFLSGFHGAYAKLVERVCSARLDIHKRFTKVPQQIETVGDDDRMSVLQWTGQDIQKVSKVAVEIQNPLMQTTQGRMEIADRYVANGWIQTPEQYSMVMVSGRAEPLYRRDRDEIRLIRSENERMREGQQVAAFITDRHTLHIREHSTELSNPEVRFDEAKAALVVAHIQEHIDIGSGLDPYILMAIGEPVPEGPPEPPEGGIPEGEPPIPIESTPFAAGPMGVAAEMPDMPQNPLGG